MQARYDCIGAFPVKQQSWDAWAVFFGSEKEPTSISGPINNLVGGLEHEIYVRCCCPCIRRKWWENAGYTAGYRKCWVQMHTCALSWILSKRVLQKFITFDSLKGWFNRQWWRWANMVRDMDPQLRMIWIGPLVQEWAFMPAADFRYHINSEPVCSGETSILQNWSAFDFSIFVKETPKLGAFFLALVLTATLI